MKKRSKVEVEIRNILSESLLVSLKARERSALLYLIFRFCRFIEEKGKSRIRLRNLLEHQEDVGWLQFSWKEVSDELNSLSIFEIDSEDYIQLKSRFRGHLPDICNKAEKYWNFISDLYSKGEIFKDGIEGEVKKGILLFNEGFYFECHELLEGTWKKERGKEKSFLKGLIHAAVAFYHLEYENYKGTANYLRRSYLRLKEFKPVFLSVDIKTFLADLEGYLKHLEESGAPNPESLKIRIPRIGLIE